MQLMNETPDSNIAKKEYILQSAERTEALICRMIAWAEGHMGNTGYAGWCLSFVEDAL
ncbi:MAG: hypothetical protein MJ136_03940 [Clostridia bacterium]|nr:hypothetical protein [Clostridia bacterium]